jgi:hypothetical protein
MGMAVLQCPAGSDFDAVRGIKIRFAHLQVNDVGPLAFHFIGPLEDIHDDERGYFLGAFGNHDEDPLLRVSGYGLRGTSCVLRVSGIGLCYA